MDKDFFIQPGQNKRLTYEMLWKTVNDTTVYFPMTYLKNAEDIFLQIIVSLLAGMPLTLLDRDFSDEEIYYLTGKYPDEISTAVKVSKPTVNSVVEFSRRIEQSRGWTLTMFTSGTTGHPKKVTHTFSTLARKCMIGPTHVEDIWGFTYHPAHIAGIKVFLQAFLNGNPIINLFGQTHKTVLHALETYKVTHLSATPTFYRMLFPVSDTFPAVSRITFSGERFDPVLANELRNIFPNARHTNIYASTEGGSLLASSGEHFSISSEYRDIIRIIDGELCIHYSILGKSDSFEFRHGWYHTGDMVEIVDLATQAFRFLSRRNEMINVGGYKVNPSEVEAALCEIDGIKDARVYGKKNSLTGNLVACEVVAGKHLSETEIRAHLAGRLQEFKIPRLIHIVERIEMTRTGKKKRP